MNSITRSLLAVSVLCAPMALAQKWEVGGGAGGGFYTSQNINSPSGSASAKFQNNVAASAWVGNNNGTMFGGEFRYDYQRGDAQLSSGGSKAAFAAQSHAMHYDFHLHFGKAESPIMPFLAAGGGIKIYQGVGSEVAYQPLSNIGLLTKTSEMKPMVSLGGGIKFRISHSLGFRAEVHDYITPFPKNVITPSANAKVGGFLQDIVATVGISLLF